MKLGQKLTIEDLIPENKWKERVKNELKKTKEIEKWVDRENLVYRTNEYTFSFKNFRTINTFGRDICNGIVTLKEANKDQSDLLVENMNFKKKIKPQNPEKKQKKGDVPKNLFALSDDRQRVLDAFGSKIFPIKIERTGFSDKASNNSNLKILTPKQIPPRLPIALAQIKAGNTIWNFTKWNQTNHISFASRKRKY